MPLPVYAAAVAIPRHFNSALACPARFFETGWPPVLRGCACAVGMQSMSLTAADFEAVVQWQNWAGMLTVTAVVAAQLRLLAAWRFQEHLSLTPNAVLAALPDLASLMLIAMFTIPALAGWGNLVLGSTYAPLSTYWGSVRFLLTLLVTGTRLHSLRSFAPYRHEQHPADHTCSELCLRLRIAIGAPIRVWLT